MSEWLVCLLVVRLNIICENPELVQTDSLGYKTVNYDGVIPVLVEAIKELNNVIEDQYNTIKKVTKLVERGEHELNLSKSKSKLS